MTRALWWLAIVLQPILVARLLSIGLLRQYPLFCAWLAVDTLVQAIRILQPTSAMWRVWAATEPLLIIMCATSVLELYRRRIAGILDRHHLRWIVVISSLALAATLSLAIAGPAWIGRDRLQWFLIAGKRVILSVLAITMAGSLAGSSLFTLPLRGNLRTHTGIMFAYLASWSIGWWLMEIGGREWVAPISAAIMAVWCGCLVAWLLLLRRGDYNLPRPGDHNPLEGEIAAIRRSAAELLRALKK